MNSLFQKFTFTDKILLLLGITGIFIYLFFLPSVHPDAAPAYKIDQETVLDQAKSFAFDRGYNVSNYEWKINPIRARSLFRRFRENLDEPALIDKISNSDLDHLPIYGWEVSTTDSQEEDGSRIELTLSQLGEVSKFQVNDTEDPLPIRDALLQTTSAQSLPTEVRDTLATSYFVGQMWMLMPPPADTSRSLPPPPLMSPHRDSLSLPFLTRNDALAIANYYAQKTILRHFSLQADSVYHLSSMDPNTIRVSWIGEDKATQIPVWAHVDITSSGVLKNVSATFEEDSEEGDSAGFSITFSDEEGLLGIIPALLLAVTYAALFIFVFIIFLRRLNARLVDVKSAMQDAIWGGFFATLAFVFSWLQNLNLSSDSLFQDLLPLVFLTIVTGSVGSFLIFIISSATGSTARTSWKKRLSSLTLARNARFFNIPVGSSLIKGLGLAGILLGLSTLFLYLPSSILEISSGYFNLSRFPVALTVSQGSYVSMLINMLLFMAIGAPLYSRFSNRFIVIVVIGLLAALMQLGPIEFESMYTQWIYSALLGIVLTLGFFKSDYFSSFSAFALYNIIWHTNPIWFSPSPGAELQSGMIFGLLPIVFILGLVGLISRNEADDADQYVPAYLQEMAQQERLQGELDIARQVQSSLLPRRMPELEGIEIAAMCLPAQEVGGDYFDFIKLDDHRTALVIGDVSGKGIQAGFFMTLTKGFLHAVCRNEDSPAAVLTQVNELFCKNVPRGTFISLIYGILDTSTHTFTFARAGHDPVLYLPASQEVPEFSTPTGMAIGLTASPIFQQSIQNETLPLSPNDLLVFYTDGVTEAVNPQMEQFGADRLAQKVQDIGSETHARQVLQQVSEHIQAFVKSAGRADDMTMIMLRIAPTEQK